MGKKHLLLQKLKQNVAQKKMIKNLLAVQRMMIQKNRQQKIRKLQNENINDIEGVYLVSKPFFYVRISRIPVGKIKILKSQRVKVSLFFKYLIYNQIFIMNKMRYAFLLQLNF